MNSLAIHVRSGLCNRLRVVLSALAYCEETNRRLLVHWPRVDEHATESEPERGFEAKLSDLFSGPFDEITLNEFSAFGRKISQKEIRLDTPGDLRLRTINMFPGVEPPEGYPRKHESHQFLAERWYRKSLAEYWSVMRPTAVLQEFIDIGLSLIDWENVAVKWDSIAAVIRLGLFTDTTGQLVTNANFETPLRSPPQKFIARLKQLPQYGKIFLACDCQHVEDLFREAFGSRVVQLPQTYIYDRETIFKRMAELYVAASCQKILGSYVSSYSEFSGWLAGGMYSACYQWPANEKERYEDVGLWEEK